VGLSGVVGDYRKHETSEIGVDYISHFSNDRISFTFSVRTDCKGTDINNWETLGLSLYFYNNFDLCQFSANQLFRENEKVDMKTWAQQKAIEYDRLREACDLNLLFGDREIRVRGIANVTNSTLIEFIIILKGYQAWGADRLLVYRLHHGRGKDETLSYAMFIESRHLIYDYSFWCVFPTFVGMTGGTSHSGYIQTEALLKQAARKLNLRIVDIFVNEEMFLRFLREKNVPFRTYDDLFEDSMRKIQNRKAGISSQAQTLLRKLQQCESGQPTWKEYENIVNDAFSYLFSPPLGKSQAQSRTDDGFQIRDFIFPNHALQGFWSEARNDHKAFCVVVEAKNKETPSKQDVMQLASYLNERQAGLFGILVARKQTDQTIKERRISYSVDHKMIVLLDDRDLQEMILKKTSHKKPEELLMERVDSYRIQYGY
jgi:hypothetical protein